jgi:HK97 family phage major capsid protein
MNLTKSQQQRIDKAIAEKHYRSFGVTRSAINEEARTVEIAFSSEDPYGRWFGIEILGHEKGEVVMDFLASGRAPLLDQHNHGRQIGVIEKAWIDPDRVGRAIVRFGKSAGADEFFQDVVDGIRANISVGYNIHEMKLIETSDEQDSYRVTNWEPFEVSFVTVPADKTVGVGRAQEESHIPFNRGEHMTPEEKAEQERKMAELKEKAQKDARKAEVTRIKEISALGQMHNMAADAQRFIEEDKPIEMFREYVLAELGKRGVKPVETPDPKIGMSKGEIKRFSFIRAINALANPTDKRAQEEAAFEFEASDAVSVKLKRAAQGIMVPMEVLQRDLTVGTDTAGGHLVATNLLAASFIEMLRNRMMVAKMGATTLTGLIGDIAIPKQTGGATAYWLAEGDSPTESAAAFGQVAMTPKTVGAFSDISRKLLKQSSVDIENLVRSDLAKVLALAIDSAGINGTASNNQPRGLLATSGIGAVVGGDNGAAPDWADVVGLWSEVAVDNADIGSTGFLTNSKVIGKLMTTEKASGTAQFVVANFPDANGFTSLAGARCGVSNQVPSNLTKGTSSGVCSAIVFGNWADLLVGMWGTLDITVDPYSLSTSGAVRVVALQDVDIAVRHAESFAAMVDALTA